MARGRPRGAIGPGDPAVGSALHRCVEAAPGGTLFDKLTIVAEDPSVALPVQLEALRRLFALFAGRTVQGRANASADARLN